MAAGLVESDELPGMEALHGATRTWFYEALETPTRIQREAWPVLASGRSALLLAPTGSRFWRQSTD
jgi:ATP-dependent Lhr-like helicase